MTQPPPTFDAKEAGKIIGKSAWWMKDMARRGEIPCTRPGRSYLWTTEQLAEILRMFERRPRTPALPAPRSPGKHQDDGAVPLLRSKPPVRPPRAA